MVEFDGCRKRSHGKEQYLNETREASNLITAMDELHCV